MSYQIKIDTSPIYELLGSFMAYVTKKWVQDMDLGHEWIDKVDARLQHEVRTELATAQDCPFSDYDALYAWALLRPESDEISDYISYLDHGPDKDMFELLVPHIPFLTFEESLRIRKVYTPLLKLWDRDYFRALEGELRVLAEEDAAEKRMLLSKMEPEALVEYATAGLVVPHMEDLDTVVLFPVVHNRPINSYCFYTRTLLIQYPVDIPEESEKEPPTLLLRLTRAVNDPQRLRILRYVAQGPKSLEDMRHDLSRLEDTLMSDMMILRVAGLLRIHIGRYHKEKFSIRPDGAADLQVFLESYIGL
ncbi:ArsR family transcriptional regulator [Paenibacillus polymyxa]|uniref:ArsR family transcriptional regulator n=1 Tax=Paenibacillus polymyxa TaxID=1406 RepID=UPI0008FC2418|nr:ArsR family transcriptional regulator [Paenibacillus polymyxa]APB71029.1 ArsR family transcriptional regulator [Paenibacillus polymyxa]